jgi:hypothetical protein
MTLITTVNTIVFFTPPSSTSSSPLTHPSSDTIRIKHAALSLLSHAESEGIYFALSNRLERMVRTDLDTKYNAPRKRGQEPFKQTVPSIHDCAITLRGYLKKWAKERVATGECELFVKHELQWADWFEEASRVGVLHLKVEGCRCRPEWEDEEGVR